MEAQHLPDIHNVNVITAENANVIRLFIKNEIQVLVDRICCAAIPVSAHSHLRRNSVHVLIQGRRKPPRFRKMDVQGVGFELRKHFDFEKTGVDEVVQGEIDDPESSSEVDG